MSQPAWEAIGVYRAGVVPVNYSLQEGPLPALRRGQVRHQRARLLRARAGQQRRRRRRGGRGVDQGVRHGLAADEPQLGGQLAERRLRHGAEPVVQGGDRRRQVRRGGRRGAGGLAVRLHLPGLGQLLLGNSSSRLCYGICELLGPDP